MSGKWFGIVRWCDEDIAGALKERGFEANDYNIGMIRELCSHHSFKDQMISAGWDYINSMIEDSKFALDM